MAEQGAPAGTGSAQSLQPALPFPRHGCPTERTRCGLWEHAAALLASHGYAALALAYFGVEDVPKDLINIPLEYFGTALR